MTTPKLPGTYWLTPDRANIALIQRDMYAAGRAFAIWAATSSVTTDLDSLVPLQVGERLIKAGTAERQPPMQPSRIAAFTDQLVRHLAPELPLVGIDFEDNQFDVYLHGARVSHRALFSAWLSLDGSYSLEPYDVVVHLADPAQVAQRLVDADD